MLLSGALAELARFSWWLQRGLCEEGIVVAGLAGFCDLDAVALVAEHEHSSLFEPRASIQRRGGVPGR